MEEDEYHLYLQSLDNSQLLNHITQISQDVAKSDNPLTTSTPKQSQVTSTQSSDPFDDGLDSQLINILSSNTVLEKLDDAKNEHNEVDDELDDDNDEDASEEETIGELHKFGDYKTYFENKHAKQQVADDLYVEWENQRKQNQYKPLFKDCIIYVNGHTDPSINEIHRLVVLYGGKFLSYLTNKSAATHIICDKLTPRKNIEFRNFKVVKAKWLTDSIAQDQLLLWRDYRTISDIEYGQKRLQFTNQNEKESNTPDPLVDEVDLDGDLDVDNDFSDHHQVFSDDEIIEPAQNDATGAQELRQQNADNYKAMDAKHPDFLKHFFARSRLHHLSAWKADLRLKVLKRILQAKKSHKNHYLGEDKLILHIDFDCFFATASCLNFPNLDINKDPIVVTHGGKSSDIASCNYVTRKFGVRNGMWVANAEKLCPQMIKLDYDFDAYEKYSNAFYGYLLENEKFDSVFPVLIDEVLIDASSFLHSAADKQKCVEDLCSELRQGIYELTKCTVSIGASRNVLLAKLATKKIKPNGQFYLCQGIDTFLDVVPIRDMPGIGRSIEIKFQESLGDLDGTPKIRDILQYSKSRLMAQFGQKTGEKLFNFSRGIDDTNITLDASNPETLLGRKSVSVDVNFGIRFDTMDQLDIFLMKMAEELYKRLVNLGVCGSTLTMRLAKRAPGAPINPAKHLGMGMCDFINKSSRLGVATSDWGIIGSELKAMYRMLNIPVLDLRGIAITMAKLEDVNSVAKSNQATLRFNNPRKHKSTNMLRPNILENSLSGLNGLEELNNIDWSVFEMLPLAMKHEITRELTRRGIANKIPSKPGVKTSLQYLLPSQAGSTPKFVRVVESPKKKKLKTPNVESKSPLPIKTKQEDVYEHSGSYNLSVVEELPSFIKEEVLKDIEYQQKIKNYDLEPLRHKMNRKQLEQTCVEVVNEAWISKLSRFNPLPSFLGQSKNVAEIKESIEEWIISSLQQKGPHEDDLQVFVEYLQQLNEEQKYNICILLVKHMQKCLLYERSIVYTKENLHFIEEGLDSWDSYLLNKVVPSCEILVSTINKSS